MEHYLSPTYFIDSDHPSIMEKARSLTEACEGDRQKAVTLFTFARDEISYNPYGPVKDKNRYKASATLPVVTATASRKPRCLRHWPGPPLFRPLSYSPTYGTR